MQFAIKKVALTAGVAEQQVQVVLGAKLSHIEISTGLAPQAALVTLADPSIDAVETVTLYTVDQDQAIDTGSPFDALQVLAVVPDMLGHYVVARRSM